MHLEEVLKYYINISEGFWRSYSQRRDNACILCPTNPIFLGSLDSTQSPSSTEWLSLFLSAPSFFFPNLMSFSWGGDPTKKNPNSFHLHHNHFCLPSCFLPFFNGRTSQMCDCWIHSHFNPTAPSRLVMWRLKNFWVNSEFISQLVTE